MTPEFDYAAVAPPGEAQAWREVWLSALARPSAATYAGLVNRPNVTLARAYLWVLVSALAGTFLSVLLQWAFAPVVRAVLPDSAPSGFGPATLVCAPAAAAVLTVMGLTLGAGYSHLIARALGGTGTFTQLAYAVAAYVAPLGFVLSVVSALPLLVCLTLPLALYGLALNVIAIKGTHQLSWGRAIASSGVILGLGLFILGLLIIVILALTGPAIGNVFSNIIQDLGTPAP